jgi:hypothetical protein
LAGLEEVVLTVKASPSPDPEPAFWEHFQRELHLKLAQSVPAPSPSPFSKITYYLLGAPALAVLLFWAFTHLSQPHKPVLITAMAAPEQVVYVGREDGAWQGEEFPSWDMEAVMADLTHQERELVLQKIRY